MPRNRALISATNTFRAGLPGEQTICFENTFCKIELCMELVLESIQATICSIRVVKQGIRQRVERRCRVACSTRPYSRKIIDGKTAYVANASSGEVVLLDPGRHATPEGSEGYLDLSRRVVSVEHEEGNLELVVQAYSSSGDITAQGHVSLAPRSFGFSQKKFYVDDAVLEITVAWSFLVAHKDTLVRPVGIWNLQVVNNNDLVRLVGFWNLRLLEISAVQDQAKLWWCASVRSVQLWKSCRTKQRFDDVCPFSLV